MLPPKKFKILSEISRKLKPNLIKSPFHRFETAMADRLDQLRGQAAFLRGQLELVEAEIAAEKAQQGVLPQAQNVQLAPAMPIAENPEPAQPRRPWRWTEARLVQLRGLFAFENNPDADLITRWLVNRTQQEVVQVTQVQFAVFRPTSTSPGCERGGARRTAGGTSSHRPPNSPPWKNKLFSLRWRLFSRRWGCSASGGGCSACGGGCSACGGATGTRRGRHTLGH